MPLIRCLGAIKLPATYRTFFNYEADLYKRKRLYDPALGNEWLETAFSSAEVEQLDRIHEIRGHTFKTVIPTECEKLAKILSKFYKGRQSHVGMTLVSTDMHTNLGIGQNATVLLIPYHVSNCHYLRVEDEERQLKANHIYAFNQLRSHGVIYKGPREEHLGSSPCSALSVSFKKLG